MTTETQMAQILEGLSLILEHWPQLS
jgi:hypothetical protein